MAAGWKIAFDFKAISKLRMQAKAKYPWSKITLREELGLDNVQSVPPALKRRAFPPAAVGGKLQGLSICEAFLRLNRSV